MASVEDLVDDEAEPAEDYILTVADLGADEADVDEISAPSAHRLRLVEKRDQFKRNDADTGSPEFQVAGMTERISYLTSHLKMHPKDFSTRRGLVALVNKRRRLLNYLSGEDVDRYQELIGSLGIRHKAPGLIASKEEMYGRFPNQKAVKKHLVKKRK
jgi:small subunit ribosomal protein S15